VFERPTLVRGRIGDHPIDFTTFMAFGQVLRNRHAIFANKQQTVAIFVDLHFVARADPSPEFGFGLFVFVEITGAERLAEFIDVHGQSFDDRIRDGCIRMHRRSTFLGKTLYELHDLLEAFLRRFSHGYAPTVMWRLTEPLVYKGNSLLYNPSFRRVWQQVMTNLSRQHALIQQLSVEVGAATAELLVAGLRTDTPDADAKVLLLLDELQGLSAKVASAAMAALPELDRRAGLSHVALWLDLGITLAESSGASALKYFKDSPLVLGLIEQADTRTEVLTIGLEVAEQDANVALEYIRHAPQILSDISPTQLRAWLDIGIELTQVNAVIGLEFIRHISKLVSVLPFDSVRRWATVGMKLVIPNSLGKPDYVATMEFLRTSPMILGNIEDRAVRAQVVSLCLLLAERSPESSITWLAESPDVLRALPSMEWRIKVVQYGALLAEKNAEVTLLYLRRAPELVRLIGNVPDAAARFERWFTTGMEVVAYSPDGARAYFGVESRKALASVEQALSGVPFRQVARRVKLFVQGLCGTDVAVTALPDSVTSSARAKVSADGRSMALPALVRRYPTAAENERLYLVMAAHEAGHVEFGTYRLTLDVLADLVDTVRHRYGRSKDARPETLAALFQLYPHASLMRDLWVVLEDARVEHLLQSEYPGLRRDLARFAAESITPRDPAQGVTPKELVVDCLLRLSTGDAPDSVVPKAVTEEVSILWDMCQAVLKSTATAEETVRVVDRVYVRLEELLPARGEMIIPEQPKEAQKLEVGQAQPEQTGEAYRVVTDVIYRGSMNPEFITWSQERLEQKQEAPAEPDRTMPRNARRGEQESGNSEIASGGRSLPSVVEECLTLEVEAQPIAETGAHEGRAILYPEWDHRIDDYRMNWCCVVERPAGTGSDEFVSATLAAQQSTVRSLRRFFEGLRPPAFRRVMGQPDGEEVDLDAVVRRAGELRAGMEGGDRLYIRREKRERNVAVAFLVDISGSTSRELGDGRRVIDIEKESLVLLCEALDAVGDQYGLYAYSGQGRAKVDFLTIKDFDERLGAATAHRLGGLASHHQNRDGAAIRHTTAKLLARDVKHRILVLLSDGRPLDDLYKDEYALEDTKVALREARQRSVETFCVTIDREAESYVRRMYADAQYCVIDSIEALPMKLPRIYRQLTA
jgi:nitric oxide reductase NorD protein